MQLTQARPLAQYLVLLVLSILIPSILLAGSLVWHISALDRERADGQALQLARTAAGAVDRDLEGSTETLLALASSPSLLNGDFAAFHRQAKEAMMYRGLNVLMRAPDGQQILNTRVPWGTPILAQKLSEFDRKVIATRQPVATDLVIGAVTQDWILALSVPVIDGDNVRYILSMSIEPEHIRRIIAATPRAKEWIIAVSDRTGRLIARSVEQENFVGRDMDPELKSWSSNVEGVHRTPALAGATVVRGYHWSSRSGWLVAAFVPASVVDAPLRRMWATFSLLVLALGGLAVPLAYFVSRAIANPIAVAAHSAHALGRGEIVGLETSRLDEANLLSAALSSASLELQNRTDALAAKEQRFRSVFEQSAVGFDHLDMDGKVLAVNHRLCALLGYTREECMQKDFKFQTHPDDRPAVDGMIADLLSGKVEHFAIEKRLISKSGEPVWVHVTSSIVRGTDGQPLYRSSVVEDIRERRKSREAAARLASIVQASPDAMISTCLEGNIETWNAGAERLFGYTAEEITGKPLMLLVPQDRKDEYDVNLAAISTGAVVNIETVRRHKDGTRIDVSLAAAMIIADGHHRSISITMEDIRGRKRRESHIILLNRELAHRVKNTLAVVQSIANQTVRSTPDPHRFRLAFQGRLQSLAAANDLLVQTSWGGLELSDFIERQLAPLMPRNTMQLSKDGPTVTVPADLSIPLGLALHELGTNSIKYGAWSNPGGKVAITWKLAAEDADGGQRLVLSWTELNGPPVATPTRSGFGTLLIERGIPGARVTRRFERSGVECTIDLPMK